MTEEEKALWDLSEEFDGLEGSQAPQDMARKREIGEIMKEYVDRPEHEHARDMEHYHLLQTAAMIADWYKHNAVEGVPKTPKVAVLLRCQTMTTNSHFE